MRGDRELLLTFVALGATGALFGPALPALARAAQATPAQASLAVAALFTGLVVGVGMLQWPGTNPDARVSALRRWGAVTQAVGLVLVPVSSSLSMLLVTASLVGIGFGISEATASAVVVSRPDGAGRLSGLGAAFAVAAVVTPAFVALSLEVRGGVWPVFAMVAAVHVAAAWSVQTAVVAPTTVVAPTAAGSPTAAGAAEADALRAPMAACTDQGSGWWIGGLLVLYVGAEVLLSTWAAELTRVLLGVSASVAALAATVFWTCLAFGRLAGTWAARRVSPERLLAVVLGGAGACLSAAAMLQQRSGMAALAALAGGVVLLGPAYALALAAGDTSADGRSVRTAARRVGVGALGGAFVPAAVAPVAARPLGVLATAAALLVAAALLGSRLRPEPRTAEHSG
jgi:fucose permease